LIFIFALLVIAIIVPQGSAGYSPYERAWMFITYPPGDYGRGDLVTFTVHVFEEGEYITPDTIEAECHGHDVIPIQEMATGRYTFDYRISDRDLQGSSPGFSISVTAKLFGRTGWDGEPVDIILNQYAGLSFPRPFELDLSIDDVADLHPSPGDTVEFSISTRFNGEPVDLADPPTAYTSYNMTFWEYPRSLSE